MYDDIDMRRNYNNGFWKGSSLTAIGCGVAVLVGLYLHVMGIIG